jgi:hypothetical protein
VLQTLGAVGRGSDCGGPGSISRQLVWDGGCSDSGTGCEMYGGCSDSGAGCGMYGGYSDSGTGCGMYGGYSDSGTGCGMYDGYSDSGTGFPLEYVGPVFVCCSILRIDSDY